MSDPDRTIDAPSADDPLAPGADAPPDPDFGPPFAAKSFGGAFVWARSEHYVATVLRLRAGKHVPVSTRNRKDMVLMLTGGRAVLEVTTDEGTDRVELLPAAPVAIRPDREHRVLAMTEVELFTVFVPDPPPTPAG